MSRDTAYIRNTSSRTVERIRQSSPVAPDQRASLFGGNAERWWFSERSRLDRHFHQGWISIAGIVLGALAGFVQIFRTASRYLKNDRS